MNWPACEFDVLAFGLFYFRIDRKRLAYVSECESFEYN
jgi:hypothetical protein